MTPSHFSKTHRVSLLVPQLPFLRGTVLQPPFLVPWMLVLVLNPSRRPLPISCQGSGPRLPRAAGWVSPGLTSPSSLQSSVQPHMHNSPVCVCGLLPARCLSAVPWAAGEQLIDQGRKKRKRKVKSSPFSKWQSLATIIPWSGSRSGQGWSLCPSNGGCVGLKHMSFPIKTGMKITHMHSGVAHSSPHSGHDLNVHWWTDEPNTLDTSHHRNWKGLAFSLDRDQRPNSLQCGWTSRTLF